jgi:hypothetical protein
VTETTELTIAEAEAFLKKHERHYRMPTEPVCAIGLSVEGELCGAAILGREPDRSGKLAHIYVDGAWHGYSLLYGACWRTYQALGYRTVHLK